MSREIKFRVRVNKASGDKAVVTLYLSLEQMNLLSCHPEATVDQYTGLKDKNGQEIYEGDILNIEYDQTCIGAVIFEDGGFKTTDMNSRYRLDQKSILNDASEVIGNIYEN